jgi:hypothetical protein
MDYVLIGIFVFIAAAIVWQIKQRPFVNIEDPKEPTNNIPDEFYYPELEEKPLSSENEAIKLLEPLIEEKPIEETKAAEVLIPLVENKTTTTKKAAKKATTKAKKKKVTPKSTK